MEIFNLLAIGDIIGQPGVEFVKKTLWKFRKEHDIHCVVANGENSAVGNGIDIKSANALLESGVDMITTGNHVWHKKEFYRFLDESEYVLRPANYPSMCPGKGYNIVKIMGYKILFINLLGLVYIDAASESPFITVQKIFNWEKDKYDFAVIDIHAEATSEKIALAKYIDQNEDFKASVIFGTHTHVQTADEQILKNGAGYITDLGMTGGVDSILGIKNEAIIQKFLMGMPVRFETESDNIQLEGIICKISLRDFSCTEIKKLKYLV